MLQWPIVSRSHGIAHSTLNFGKVKLAKQSYLHLQVGLQAAGGNPVTNDILELDFTALPLRALDLGRPLEHAALKASAFGES